MKLCIVLLESVTAELIMGSLVASVGKTALPSVNVAFSAAGEGETEEFVELVEWCCAVF